MLAQDPIRPSASSPAALYPPRAEAIVCERGWDYNFCKIWGPAVKWIGAWLWSRVRDNENWAQTLVRVLGNLFRIAITMVALLAASLSWQGYSNGKRDQALSQEIQSVTVTTSLFTEQNDNGCPPMFPLQLCVDNNSTKALMGMDIALSARRQGTSTNTLSYGHREVRWDRIVLPGYASTACYMLPAEAPAGAIYSATPTSYTVELRPTEQWMIAEANPSRARFRLVDCGVSARRTPSNN